MTAADLKSCFFGLLNLRMGCIAFSIVSLVLHTAFLILVSALTVDHSSIEFGIFATLYAVGMAMDIFVLFAVIDAKPKLLYAWLIFSAIAVSMTTLDTTIEVGHLFIPETVSEDQHPALLDDLEYFPAERNVPEELVLLIFPYFIGLFINLYFMAVVYSYRKAILQRVPNETSGDQERILSAASHRADDIQVEMEYCIL
uniref:Uncharacterized protein n=1 Tax=Labidocera rotunda TaxID=207950 RepID=A0A0U2UH21_9MAXI|nr:hypothetical protein [Labidocera rotunda]